MRVSGTAGQHAHEIQPVESSAARANHLDGLGPLQPNPSVLLCPYLLGRVPGAVNFAIFSRHTTGVRLDFFDRPEDSVPARSILLDSDRNKTGDIWHLWLEGIHPGRLYGFRFAGPYTPHEGHRFNPDKLVVDPYATATAFAAGDLDFLPSLGYDSSSPQRDLSFSQADDASEVHLHPCTF